MGCKKLWKGEERGREGKGGEGRGKDEKGGEERGKGWGEARGWGGEDRGREGKGEEREGKGRGVKGKKGWEGHSSLSLVHCDLSLSLT